MAHWCECFELLVREGDCDDCPTQETIKETQSMTRTQAALREGARYLLDHGFDRTSLIALYSAQAAKAADEGRHDKAAELRAAMEEFRMEKGVKV